MCNCSTHRKQYKGKTPRWPDDRKMMIDIDQLPHGSEWRAQELIVGKGEHERVHIVYKRLIVDVIRELLGSPSFKDVMRYAPEKHWTSAEQTSRIFGEMWTGNWWWRQQVS
jgi:hypothetical protein